MHWEFVGKGVQVPTYTWLPVVLNSFLGLRIRNSITGSLYEWIAANPTIVPEKHILSIMHYLPPACSQSVVGSTNTLPEI